ncbi:MAG: hypothetical protein GXX84_02730 [Acidobacteria bacterium]|nr:hypothetical protein [Acidobacteriota bacterium]
MPIQYIEKDEWLSRVRDQETILIGAFAPALNQITIEVDCKDCGRPVYVSPYEKGAARVLCIVCGMKYFSDSDRQALVKALLPSSDCTTV